MYLLCTRLELRSILDWFDAQFDVLNCAYFNARAASAARYGCFCTTTTTPNMSTQREKNEPFVVITCEEEFSQPVHALPPGKDPMYGPWGEQGTVLVLQIPITILTFGKGAAKFEEPMGFAYVFRLMPRKALAYESISMLACASYANSTLNTLSFRSRMELIYLGSRRRICSQYRLRKSFPTPFSFPSRAAWDRAQACWLTTFDSVHSALHGR